MTMKKNILYFEFVCSFYYQLPTIQTRKFEKKTNKLSNCRYYR